MEAQILRPADDRMPRFFYHLGDVIYFNGQSWYYRPQSTSRISTTPVRFLPSPATMTGIVIPTRTILLIPSRRCADSWRTSVTPSRTTPIFRIVPR
jgi:hypothetical protein